MLNDAISFAQAGSHEDLHQKSKLSQILLEVARRKGGNDGIERDLAPLRLIEEYAETMEMPSLLCDAYSALAKLLVEQGETTLAGTLLSRAIAIARRSGMGLRLNSAITRYGRVLGMRKLDSQARQLLLSSIEMAKRHNCEEEISRVKEALNALH